MKLFPRTVARFAAVQAVFQKIMCPNTPGQTILNEFLTYRFTPSPLEQSFSYAISDEETELMDCSLFLCLVKGVFEDQIQLDAAIFSALPSGWSLEKMEYTTRGILLCGAFELLKCPDTPKNVILNEYVSLSHRFLLEKGPQFINAVLETLANTLRSSASVAPTEPIL